jgi:peptide methionine sulfoxide reductase msrA/msrB
MARKKGFARLSPEEERVIVRKGTEAPFSGEYVRHFDAGYYLCRRCGAPLYRSDDKFRSDCGWPSFDDELPGAVRRLPDADGARTEIQCSSCGGHLGHIFLGERLTGKNVRHCVNSLSLRFVPAGGLKTSEIVLGGGCFWCTEAVFRTLRGVLLVEPGYAGGAAPDPTYEQVCSGTTGHAEVVRVVFHPDTVPLEKVLALFFQTHDPTSPNRQGADAGTQYRSAVYYTSEKQGKAVRDFVEKLQADYDKPIVTEIRKLGRFYPAEEHHRDYFRKNPLQPYCMMVVAPKVKKAESLQSR